MLLKTVVIHSNAVGQASLKSIGQILHSLCPGNLRWSLQAFHGKTTSSCLLCWKKDGMMTGMLFTAVYPLQFLNILASEGQKISENVMHWDYYSWLFFKEKKKKQHFTVTVKLPEWVLEFSISPPKQTCRDLLFLYHEAYRIIVMGFQELICICIKTRTSWTIDIRSQQKRGRGKLMKWHTVLIYK